MALSGSAEAEVHGGHEGNIHLNYVLSAKGGGYVRVFFLSPVRKHWINPDQFT